MSACLRRFLSCRAPSRPALRVQSPSFCTKAPTVGSANLDWSSLGFEFRPTRGFVKFTWKEGRWDEGTFETEPYFKMHVMSAAVHYGQGLFEGAKAHHCADGKVRLWNINENAVRMQQGASRMLMPEVPVEMFTQACEWVIKENLAYMPPYGTGGSMYLRPFLFGHGPQLGLQPAPEYTFAVLAIPVSSYYKGGLSPVSVLIVDNYDRSAPKGVGNVKCSGNYGADILPSIQARSKGYPTVLYLDAAKKKYIEEFSVSNFIGIDQENGKYVTPKSDTILMSTTNKMLMQLAPKFGLTVEHRPVPVTELAKFDEVAGCGTAVVLMGVKDITHGKTVYRYRSIETVEKLYSHYRAIQFGEEEDTFGWGQEIGASEAAAEAERIAASEAAAKAKAEAAASAALADKKPKTFLNNILGEPDAVDTDTLLSVTSPPKKKSKAKKRVRRVPRRVVRQTSLRVVNTSRASDAPGMEDTQPAAASST